MTPADGSNMSKPHSSALHLERLAESSGRTFKEAVGEQTYIPQESLTRVKSGGSGSFAKGASALVSLAKTIVRRAIHYAIV